MSSSLELKNNLVESMREAVDRLANLKSELNTYNWKILDIEHFIRLGDDLNAAQGYNAYRLLKDVLVERGNIKDEISELQLLVDMINTTNNINVSAINKIDREINNKIKFNTNEDGRRKYRVRAMQDIFGETIKKTI